MTVQCSEYKDCPDKKCEHKKPHDPIFTWVYVGGKGDVPDFCDNQSHNCGLRFPWIEVICLPVEAETISATNQAAELVPA